MNNLVGDRSFLVFVTLGRSLCIGLGIRSRLWTAASGNRALWGIANFWWTWVATFLRVAVAVAAERPAVTINGTSWSWWWPSTRRTTAEELAWLRSENSHGEEIRKVDFDIDVASGTKG
jgi:hypothetical protein